MKHAIRKVSAVVALSLGVAACTSDAPSPVEEVLSRDILFAEYPSSGFTYLSFSKAHGFQVNYLKSGGEAWLWYPGNSKALYEQWKTGVISGQNAVCWRHPSNSYNPVTGQTGGQYACEPLAVAQKSQIARLAGDPYNLSSGRVPHRLERCKAPSQFDFDRERYKC
ncbi:hypothetical protein [Shimia sp.]|uniref:hypothetical protein n=1 Tax=Shimia sp. TaxID=1954381 RepID=UPI003BA9F32C